LRDVEIPPWRKLTKSKMQLGPEFAGTRKRQNKHLFSP